MTPERWKELGYQAEIRSQYFGGWTKTLPNGYQIVVTDADEKEPMPKEYGPFLISYYAYPAEEDRDLIAYVVIGNNDKLDDLILTPFLHVMAVVIGARTRTVGASPTPKETTDDRSSPTNRVQ